MKGKFKSKDSVAEGTSTVDSSSSRRIRFRDRKYNKEGYAEETDGAPTIKEGKDNQEITAYAVTVLRTFKQDGKYGYSMIIIDDDGLRTLLLHALGHHPWLRHATIVSLFSLFQPIVHN